MLHLDKLEVRGTVAAQVFEDLIDVRDPSVVILAEFLLDFLLELHVVEDAKGHSVLLAEESMVLIETIEVTVIEFLYQNVAHCGLLKMYELLHIDFLLGLAALSSIIGMLLCSKG